MKVLDPQSAILSNVEVLAHFTLNPPRRPPNPPPNANPRTFAPRPDLRDHNTVAKEFHDYVSRLSPHLLKYPSFRNPDVEAEPSTTTATTTTTSTAAEEKDNGIGHTGIPLDAVLRSLITRLKPFQLTKAEVLMMINLGAGLESPETNRNDDDQEIAANDAGATAAAEEKGEKGEVGDIVMEDDGDTTREEDDDDDDVHEGEEDVDGDDYGAMAILSTVIEDRAERLTDEDLLEIIGILRETLGVGRRRAGVSGEAG